MTAAENQAVFLSYASQDAEAARRICETLRTSGVEVWFDVEGGLEHGDEWDAKIRRQIKECVLFIPLISANTQARHEGYFRIEWDLAAERARGIASGVPFILPVVIDDTREPDALVPDRFRAVQWTKLRAGEIPPDVQQRFLKLWSHRTGVLKHESHEAARGSRPVSSVSASGTEVPDATGQETRATTEVGRPLRGRLPLFAIAALLLFAGLSWKFSRHGAPSTPSALPSDAARQSGLPTPLSPAAPLTEAQKLVAKAAKLLDEGDELKRENYFLAEDLVKKAVALDLSDPFAWAFYARLSFLMSWHSVDLSESRREAMRRQAERARALAADSVEVQLVAADVRIYLKQDLPGVERELLAIAAREPRNWRVQRSLGLIYRVLGRPDESIQALKLARDFSGRLPSTTADLVNALLRAHRHTEAENLLAEALATQTSGRLLTFDLILRTQWRGDLPAAVAALERWPDWLLSEDRGAILAWRTWLWNGNHDKALLVLRRLPHDYLRDTFFTGPRAVLSARAHEAAGHADVARAEWQTVVQVANRELTAAPADIYASYWKAWALARLGDKAGAQTICVQMEQRGQLSLSEEARGKTSLGSVALYFGGPGAAPLWVTVGRADLALAELSAPATVTNIFAVSRAMLELDPAFEPLRKEAGFAIALARLPVPTKPAPESSPVALAKADPKSVAVLAFTNKSADPDNEYFSDGVADELQTVLKKIPGLRVAAQTSAFSFKGKNATVQEVGEKLGVAHVVDGSVQKSGKLVKITARLSRAATNEEVWSESFGPLELTDVFTTQSEIAQKIVAGLRGQLTGETTATATAAAAQAEIMAQVQAATKGGTKNPEAHQLYLQGRFLATRSSSAEVAQGVAYFEEALKLDPAFTMAWGALARARLWQVSWEPLNPVRAEQARTAATAALALDPDFADAHSAMSQVMLRHTFDWRGARAASARALKLAPNDAAILTDAAATEQALGHLEHSVELARRAVEFDPVSVDTRFFLGLSYQYLGRLKEAEEESRRMIELSSTGIFAHCLLSIVLLMQDRKEEGLAEALKEPEKMYRLQALAMARYSLGHRPESDEALQTLIAEFAETGPWAVAVVYIWRGERDQAFHWLDRAWLLRDAGVSWARADTLVGKLRDDSRWPEFLRKIGLDDDQLK